MARASSSELSNDLLELAGRVQAIILLAPRTTDRDAICTLLRAPRPLRTLSEVAVVFGRSTNTVQRSWRSNGMPGKPGAFDAADILAWHFEREARNQARFNGRDAETVAELARIEVETARVNLDYRRSRAALASGNYLDARLIAPSFVTLASRVRDRIMRLPDDIASIVPRKLAPRVRREVDGVCRQTLQAFVDDGTYLAEHAREHVTEIKQRGEVK